MTSSSLQLSWGGSTDRGLRRATNQDSFVADPPIFLVADGMGGHEGGAEASSAAVQGFRSLIGQKSVSVEQIEAAFLSAVDGVDAIQANGFPAGTTLSGVAVCEQAGSVYWLILNIGDSRTYRMTGGGLEQVSVDHSAVQSLLERGEIAAAEVETHPQRNVVTRAVGAGSAGVPDYWLLPAVEGDRLLVCSDGLTKELDDGEIAVILREEPSADAAATRLVHEALLHGGRDNVTAVVVDAHAVLAADDSPTAPAAELDEDTRPREIAPNGGFAHGQL